MDFDKLLEKIANLEERIEQLENKPKKPKKHLFVNSEYYDIHKFSEALPEWSKEKKRYYYDSCLGYSGANVKMYADWILAVKNWDRRNPYKEHTTKLPLYEQRREDRSDITNLAGEILRNRNAS